MNDTAHSYDSPTRECDLIMKGGVTSGLVYPQAVLELARNSKDRPGYSFRSIGGASAGAVAAVLAAAAQYNRPAGFQNLEAVNTELQSKAGEISFLQSLFQAKASMQPLLDIVLRLDDYGKVAKDKGLPSAILVALRDSRIPGRRTAATIGALMGVIVAAVFAAPLALAGYWGGFIAVGLVLAVLCALIGGVAGWLYRSIATILRLLTVELPQNYFGICSGMNEPPAETRAVTEWLHESTQKIAGETEVLTFGQLKNRGVTLELMTTNVSENRPYAFPFEEPFILCRADFAKLFPNAIVEAMTKAGKQRNASQFPGVTLPEDYFFLPKPDDLPIVVAARMSMSFPLFFSSIPLYALPLAQRERLESDSTHAYAPAATDLIPHWFSDGGICSNFPIHFFDAWLPTRPTFGITLRYLPGFLRPTGLSSEEKLAAQHYRNSVGAVDDSESSRPLGRRLNVMLQNRTTPRDEPLVVLPKPTDSVPPEWCYISTPRVNKPGLDSVPNFLWAVMSSMQNFRDDLQAALPSYRERVVQIRLNPDEGGFNLDMEPQKIQKVVGKGRLAGEKLDMEFVDSHHRWVRLLVLTSELERIFRAIREKHTDEEFARLIDQQCCTEGYPYREKDSALCKEMHTRLAALSAAMEDWASKPKQNWFKSDTLPPVMRVTPKI
jgi:predicted acylesterase/phospholipase RssA